jgi:hypothetical protein
MRYRIITFEQLKEAEGRIMIAEQIFNHPHFSTKCRLYPLRDVTLETAEKWLEIFKADEPNKLFCFMEYEKNRGTK